MLNTHQTRISKCSRSMDEINDLFKSQKYKEALTKLFGVKQNNPFGDSEEFNNLIDSLIATCFMKLKLSVIIN